MTRMGVFASGAYPAIQHVTTSLDIGGAQAMLAKLVEVTSGRTTSVKPWAITLRPPGVLASRFVDAGCRIYSLGVRGSMPGPLALLKLLRITTATQPDLIQGWMYHGNLAATIAGFTGTRRIPTVWNIRHSLNDIHNETFRTRALLSLSSRLSHLPEAIIYNSRTAMQEHQTIGFCAERSVHIPNGFNCSVFRPDRRRRGQLKAMFGIDPEPLVVAMVARLHAMKDHNNLVEAVARVRQSGLDIHLLLAGPGFDHPPPALLEDIRTALPENRVTLVAERLDVADWLPAVDIVALSSAWGEGFPNILGEAMACGIPCVATDVGDSEWVMGQGGIVVPPRDPEALASALAYLGEAGTDTRHAMGDAGRARLTQYFDMETVTTSYRTLWQTIMERSVARNQEGASPLAGVREPSGE